MLLHFFSSSPDDTSSLRMKNIKMINTITEKADLLEQLGVDQPDHHTVLQGLFQPIGRKLYS